MVRDAFEVNDGSVEDFSDIRTIDELREALANVDGNLPTRDPHGHPLSITVYKPTNMNSYVEVQ